jgi:hypothetical protein
LLAKFNYTETSKFEINKEGYNAYQIFKIFYGNNEIVLNKKKYTNFGLYLKSLMNHKDVEEVN